MKRALIFASVASMIDQFNRVNISKLQELGYVVEVACNFEEGNSTSMDKVVELRKELESKNIVTHHIPIPRSIKSIKNIIESLRITKDLSNKKTYDIVHCHSPIGGVIARQIFKYYIKKGTKIIYTAHGFHFYKGAPFKNWLVYYPIEKWYSRYTSVLITINTEDYDIAKKKFSAKRIEYVPGIGIDTEKYSKISVDKIDKARELGIPLNSFLILSVGELNKNKNHEIIIRAVKEMNNPNIFYIICGQGKLEKYLNDLIDELGMTNQVKLLGFRRDVIEIGKISDLYAFPSFREGLSVALMEAMAVGLPIVCSNIRGNIDLIENSRGGYLTNPNSISENVIAIETLYLNKELREGSAEFNLNKIKKFDSILVGEKITKIYNLN